MINHLNGLNAIIQDPLIFDLYNAWYKFPNMRWDDCFSKSQIESKIWIIDKILELDLKPDITFIYGGWLGSLSHLLFRHNLSRKIRSFDLDMEVCKAADLFMHRYKERWQYKSVCWDLRHLNLDEPQYDVFKHDNSVQEEYLIPDLVINTICEHLTDVEIQNSTYPDITYIFQSNNAFNEPDHINCKNSLEEFEKSLNLDNVLYSGELSLRSYKRFMVIGSKK